MRIVCVGIEAAVASAIAARLRAEVDTCSPAELSTLADRDVDAVVLGGAAFGALAGQRRESPRSAWVLLGDAAEAALYAGIDVVLEADADAERVAEETWRAVSARRDAQRWPQGFIERRALIAVPEDASLEATEASGYVVTAARDAELLAALRRAHHHAVVVDARATTGSVERLVAAIRAYDREVGVAVVVASADAAHGARKAGASVVHVGAVGGVTLASLVDKTWLSWCRAQPGNVEAVQVRIVGVVGAAAEMVHELGYASWSADGVGPEVTLVGGDAIDAVAADAVAVVVLEAQQKVHEDDRFIAQVPADVDADTLSRAIASAAVVARQRTTIAALAQRLHEVDARRVGLLQRLAAAQLELDNLTTLDASTETLNRRGIEDALGREMELARRGGGTVAGCLVEIDDDAAVRERLGHRAGDDVAKVVADRIKGALRLTDSIGRVGDGAFLLLLPQTRAAEAMLVAERAREAATGLSIPWGDEEIVASVVCGVAVLAWDTATVDEAIVALRAAVKGRRAATRDTFVDALVGGAAHTQQLDQIMAELLSGEGLVAHAQPIVRVSDETTVGYEMLIRGRADLVEAPHELLRFARHRGMLVEVDRRCLQTCLEEAQRLASHLLVSINLFPTTLVDLPLSELVAMLGDVPEARLCVELSEEHFVGDPRELLGRIAALRSAGVRLAIDDVGKGRGTLDSVMTLEPEIVKIDKELIGGASRDRRKERLLRRLVVLATTLGCEVVGEGVEKVEDLDLLRELEVPYAQGFLWAEPKAMDALPTHDSRPPTPSSPANSSNPPLDS